jgi:DMSO/TMAO reductase YedYZ molybdopterin-dependent catalytic subunit
MQEEEDITRKRLNRKMFISFGVFTALNAAAVLTWLRIKNLPLDNGLLGGVQKPVRDVLNLNERIFNKTLSPDHRAKTYLKREALVNPRVNGDFGVGNDFNPVEWKLSVTKASGETLAIPLDEIKKLRKTEIVFDFKCIEGWSQVTWWAGVKFSDFVAAYHLDRETSMKYVGMATPDNEYYVGVDMPSALHPQTLLCYEMNGAPLPMEHGFPLRLIIPVKYGIKNIKRIGTMYFDNERTPDYWFERGYDYYSGL